jgi:hypothetical protein
MRVEFFSEGNQDCPAILFYGLSAAVAGLLDTFRLLAQAQERQIALHKITGITPIGGIEVTATNAKGPVGVEQLSATHFLWRRDREGWLEAAELAEPVACSNPIEGTRFQHLERHGRINVIFSTDQTW